MSIEVDELICQVCEEEPAQGVASVPGISVSLAWCSKCLQNGCYGPYDLHWANLATVASTTPFEEDNDQKVHEEIMAAVNAGHIAAWAVEMTVWRDGYKTMLEALQGGPPEIREKGDND